jgi:heterodisulfide reductase subunit C
VSEEKGIAAIKEDSAIKEDLMAKGNSATRENSAINVLDLDAKFKYEVSEQPGGENLKLCFSCGICTAGCPVTEVENDYNPRKLIRMILLGMKEEVLSSNLIWLCSLCYTCYARCPQNVKFTDIMGVLRDMAVRENYVHPSFARHINEIDRLSQQVRHQMVRAIFPQKKEDRPIDRESLLKMAVEKLQASENLQMEGAAASVPAKE